MRGCTNNTEVVERGKKMKTVCENNKCSGCMACLEICPKHAITVLENISAYNAVIDETKCIHCNLCHDKCQSNHPANAAEPIKWWQGWSRDTEIRKNSSSGGAAASIEQAFVQSDGIVCSCVFEKGEFRFSFAETTEQIKRFSGSKYVKSKPQEIYRKINDLLRAGRKVLFVGLPCQASAVKNYVDKKLQKNLYIVDLICHGSPSPKVLDLFLKQYGLNREELNDIGFRTKTKFQIDSSAKHLSTLGTRDCYTIAFLNSLSYTENCYECRYASIERVSDVTLGDSWGSEMAEEVQRKGISLILCQTEKGKELIANSELELHEVELNKAIENNHQLQGPSKMPEKRTYFLESLQDGKPFNKTVMKCYPKQCIKQMVKGILIKLRIVGG